MTEETPLHHAVRPAIIVQKTVYAHDRHKSQSLVDGDDAVYSTSKHKHPPIFLSRGP